jgi:hypothetical protein
MLYDLWDLFQQGQIDHARDTAEFAKRDAAQNADRLQKEVLRLEAKIDRLAIISQALWELVRDKTHLTEKDIEARIAVMDAKTGRSQARQRHARNARDRRILDTEYAHIAGQPWKRGTSLRNPSFLKAGLCKQPPNIAFEGSAEQRCCSVPSSLRSSAPPQRGRWASPDADSRCQSC